MRWHWAYGVSLLLVVLLGRPAGAQPEGLESYQIVRITVSDAAQLEILERLAAAGLGFEIWSDGIGLGVIDARVSPEHKPALDASGLKYVVVVADLQAHYDELFRAPLGGDFFEAYRSYDEHVAFLSALVADYPDLAEMVDLGPSVQGRRLWAIRITGPAGDKPAVMYHGGQHGNEIMGPPVIAYAARHLLTNYDADPDVRALVDGVELFLLPMMNPDGYERGSRRNANNFDLNRNWGGPGSQENPFSQPETAAMRDFFLAHPNARAHLDLHAYGQMFLWPWGHTGELCADNGTFFLISEEMHARLLAVRGTDYSRRGPIYSTIYPVSGGSVDYSYGVHQVWAYAFELNTSFTPRVSEIIPTCEELAEAIIYLTSWVYDCNENGIPDIVEIRDGKARDCNQNGAPDECEDPEKLDCNNNGVWDACDILDGTSEDCNDNAVPDECDIAAGTSQDCNTNAIPDECDIAEERSGDCNENGTPDECEPLDDCNENGVQDICELEGNDCNANEILDECDISNGTSEDCNDNGIPDECITLEEDCNENRVPDECDIADGTSEDCDRNGVPDECDSTGELFKLLPDDGAEGDRFGVSVAISGTTAIVGAYRDGDNGTNSGSAYLFDATTGQPIAKLVPIDGAARDQFGTSVAIIGEVAIVGAPFDDDNGSGSGSAYLFDTTTGQQTTKLLPLDGAEGDRFGVSVAISGTTAIVGAHWDDDNGYNAGSAYLFDTVTGRQIAKLLSDDGAAGDFFGLSVAISGTTAIVGARFDDDNGFNSGSAYLFDTATGQQRSKLLPNDGEERDYFGCSVAISGSTAIAGAFQDRYDDSYAGSAYLFDSTTGQQIAKLLSGDRRGGDQFGFSVSISGSTAIVGAGGHSDNGGLSGSAYLFDTFTGQQIVKFLPSDGADGDYFGISVSISGATAIVGADRGDDHGQNSGSAYVFEVVKLGDCPSCFRDPEWLCDGDVDGDGQVNPVDSGLVQAAFGSGDDQDLCNYDVDCDGQINPVDSGIVQSLFGTCEEPRDVCP